MKHKLGNITTIKFGPYLKSQRNGVVKYLQGNHFNRDYKLYDFSESYVSEIKVKKSDLLKENDVILASKGYNNFAWAYQAKFGACVPSSFFFVIRPKKSIVLGSYLAIALNGKRMQYELSLISAGASILSIPKTELQDVNIAIPPLEVQKRIVKAAALLDQEIELSQQILENQRKLRMGLINQLLKKYLPT